MRAGENEGLRADLAQLVQSARASNDIADRVAYARDLWPRHVIGVRGGEAAPSPPAVIVWPSTVDEVCAVVAYAKERGIALVPFGAGSGVCGGIEASAHAIVLDMKQMRGVISLDRDELLVHAQAGIIGQHLEDHLASEGFTLGHFPSSIYCSTLGGWLAARSAGQCSGRYGKIEDMVQSLTCVDGEAKVRTLRRDADGADLLPLMIGSEGVFGVITDASLRIAPLPKERVFASYALPTTEAGLHVIRDIYQAGLRPAVARLYDPFDSYIARSRSSHASRVKKPTSITGPGFGTRLLARALRFPGAMNTLIHSLPDRMLGGAMLVLVWEDDAQLAGAEKARAHAIALAYAGTDQGEDPARRWLARRHSVSYRQSPMYAAGAFVDTMEVAAPWSRLWPTFEAVREAISPHAFVMAHFSHAYPDGGSIYFTFASSAANDREAVALYDRLWADALRAAVMAGATFSHHHGVGRSKAPAMERELGAAVDLVRGIKRAMDPQGILNPGALLPKESAVSPTQQRRTPLVDVNTLTRVVSVDRDSRIIHVEGAVLVSEVERLANQHGGTLAIDPSEGSMTVARWVANTQRLFGTQGDDPVAQRIAGLDAQLHNGERISIRPAPRRAVGPDLLALFVGGQERVGVVLAAHLVMQTNHTWTTRAYTFPDTRSARSALAWMHGRGVRSLDSSITGNVLAIRYDDNDDVGAHRTEIIDEIAKLREGVRALEPVSVTHASRITSQPSEPVETLIREMKS
ncbi:MAG: FAD-binding oxidoreductase [Sandaracinaceae bacterium]|nr:FAD-binding oxidoreductase [Sandaracinaceae bacterium]